MKATIKKIKPSKIVVLEDALFEFVVFKTIVSEILVRKTFILIGLAHVISVLNERQALVFEVCLQFFVSRHTVFG